MLSQGARKRQGASKTQGATKEPVMSQQAHYKLGSQQDSGN